MLVHLYGHPCDIEPVHEIARSKNLFIVEDCAEAHGARYRDRTVGSFGDVSCFSFYGNKIITTGEGGMCLTNGDALADKMRMLKDHGMNPRKRYWHDVVGFNYRMTNLQAALGLAQLNKIERLIDRKRGIAKTYRELLAETTGIVHTPEMPWAKNAYWFYSILLDSKLRDRVMGELDRSGIETRPFFYPIHTLPPYAHGQKLPVAEQLSARGMNLPSGPKITDEEIRTVASSLQQVVKSLNT
jgi:perosamine synthetase